MASWHTASRLPQLHAPAHSCLAPTRRRLPLRPRSSAGDDVDVRMAQLLAESRSPRSTAGSPIKVVVCGGLRTPLGTESVKALSSARGLELAGALDPDPEASGQDLGQLVGLEQPLELPVLSDAVMLFASIAQARSGNAVYLDLSGNPDAAFENVRQAVAFGLSSVIAHCDFSQKQLSTLADFCEKASMGCLVTPTLSIGSLLLQQAAISLGFHYGHVNIVESICPTTDKGLSPRPTAPGPSQLALGIANELSQIGRVFNSQDQSTDDPSRGALVGEGVRIHSMRQPGILSSLDVRFAAPGQVVSLRVDTTDARAFVPGLMLAVRRAPRLKGLVYGLERIL